MTEDQKYQGALYKDKSKKQKNNNNNPNQYQHPNQYHTQNQYQPQNQYQNQYQYQPQSQTAHDNAEMAHNAYVEDCGEDREFDWAEYEEPSDSDDESICSEPPPEAPTPPSADHEEHVDVFEFLVAAGQTPNTSKMNLPTQLPEVTPSTSLVRYEPPKEEDDLLDPASFMAGEELPAYEAMPPPEFVTPAPKRERRKSKEGSEKKDKKRKRLHVDVPTDQEMIDAPPVLHSGLTGGLNRMMKPVFPPSPNYSSGDAPEVSPASPLKKSKHSKHKHAKHNSIFGMIAGSKTKTKAKTKSSKSKKSKSSSKKKSTKEKKTPHLIEYRPQSKDGKQQPGDSQVILFKPCADVFLSFVNKGPESEKGCSMNKVLKRFHRQRQAMGSDMGKGPEEKELWRSLRLRENDRGEIVLFSLHDE